jgi:hypothetical protein
MNTADVAAEVKCLRRLIGMRCSNVYDLTPKVNLSYTFLLFQFHLNITIAISNQKAILFLLLYVLFSDVRFQAYEQQWSL